MPVETLSVVPAGNVPAKSEYVYGVVPPLATLVATAAATTQVGQAYSQTNVKVAGVIVPLTTCVAVCAVGLPLSVALIV